MLPTGRLKHDPARVASVEPFKRSATPTPITCLRPELTWKPSLGFNDTLPTCTIAGLLNSARVWALMHGFDLVYDETKILSVYAAIAGCSANESAIAATDGLMMLDVLEWVQQHGFDVGGQTPFVPKFTAIEVTDTEALHHAIFVRGSTYIGLDLTTQDVTQPFGWKGATDLPKTLGHCVAPMRYGNDDFSIATWGEEVEADDAWMLSRIQEAYDLEWTFSIAS